MKSRKLRAAWSTAPLDREPTDEERIEEIRSCLRWCGQRVTRGAVAKQFKWETKRSLPKEKR